ncbi:MULTISPECIES: FtsB family cell division protein [unclassified Streptomyces]|uniref:FtsB family cell division protein n=1 Tax=unclassified Streptomyces TaxID=2593676 RepID=UPI0019030177|nr:septum formation initiator family protein [Streptomyces sp. HSG2]
MARNTGGGGAARLRPPGGARAARTPFILLVVVLLGGGLIGLLLLNSALSAGSFRLDELKRETRSLSDEEQALQRDVDAHSAPEALERRARELGMVPGTDPAFLEPDGTVRGVPVPAPDVAPPLVFAPEALTGPSGVDPEGVGLPEALVVAPASGTGSGEEDTESPKPRGSPGARSPDATASPPTDAPASPPTQGR